MKQEIDLLSFKMKKEITICDCCGEEIAGNNLKLDGLDLHSQCSLFYQDTRTKVYDKIKSEYDSIVNDNHTILSIIKDIDEKHLKLLLGTQARNMLRKQIARTFK